jgi:N-acetylmuramoyl-L-alanine amidase
MGLHKSEDNLDVAKTENAAIFYEDDYANQYEGFDPNSDEDYIVLSMFQSASIDQSIDLSQKVQAQFKDKALRHDRGVKQAGFWVLYKTTMPGILIEAGFLSNLEEEKFLMTEDGQIFIALAIYEAFTEFKQEFEEQNSNLVDLAQFIQPEEKVFYRIQFASYKKEKSLDFRKFRGLDDIKVYEHDGMFKYTTGNETDLDKAMDLKERLKKEGYDDIFIVAFFKEDRISIEEAKTINKRLSPSK